MTSLPEIRIVRAARQFRFKVADSIFTLEFNAAKGCWQGRYEEEASAEPVPWSWIKQAWFIRPDNGAWATLEPSDESLVDALEFLAFTALPHWENPLLQNYNQQTRKQWSFSGAHFLRHVSKKLYFVILRICLEHRVLNGYSTLWNLSSFGVENAGVVLRGMMGLSVTYPDDPHLRTCCYAIECLCVWLQKKWTEEWPQVWDQLELESLVKDELDFIADAMLIVWDNKHRYVTRINKSLIGKALVHRQSLLDKIFTFLVVEEVS